jgi:hypothetical protein
VPIDRDNAKRDAELAVDYRDRLVARGLSRAEAQELTVAWILSRRVDVERDERPEWERER